MYFRLIYCSWYFIRNKERKTYAYTERYEKFDLSEYTSTQNNNDVTMNDYNIFRKKCLPFCLDSNTFTINPF